MSYVQKIINYLGFTTGFIALIKGASLFKVSFILGSYTACFSAANSISPLSGVFGGLLGCCSIFSISAILRLLFFGTLPLHYLAYHVPGFFASLYWAQNNIVFRLLVPLLCMILFIMHPVGLYAAPYTLYWFIPISLYFVSHKTRFMHALSSTFIAHAVGSVIWLYTVPMSVISWYALIPVVAIERLLFALGMVVVYNLIQHVQKVVAITKGYYDQAFGLYYGR